MLHHYIRIEYAWYLSLALECLRLLYPHPGSDVDEWNEMQLSICNWGRTCLPKQSPPYAMCATWQPVVLSTTANRTPLRFHLLPR